MLVKNPKRSGSTRLHQKKLLDLLLRQAQNGARLRNAAHCIARPKNFKSDAKDFDATKQFMFKEYCQKIVDTLATRAPGNAELDFSGVDLMGQNLDGLNLARAWMLDGVAQGLGPDDPRWVAVSRCARSHREAGLAAVTGEHYEGGHWLGSFAVYLVTKRGL